MQTATNSIKGVSHETSFGLRSSSRGTNVVLCYQVIPAQAVSLSASNSSVVIPPAAEATSYPVWQLPSS